MESDKRGSKTMDYDIQMLEDLIFPTFIDDDNNYNTTTLSDTVKKFTEIRRSDLEFL
jgi:hypothetical protein